MKSLKSRLWRQDAPGPTSPSSPTAVASTVSSACGGDPGDPSCCAPHRGSELLGGAPGSLLTLALRGPPFPSFRRGPPSLPSRGVPLFFACPHRARCTRRRGPGGPGLPNPVPPHADSGPAWLRVFQPCQSWERRSVSSAVRGKSGSQPGWERIGISNADKAPLVCLTLGMAKSGK